jgi:hypothetical protein
MRKDHLVDHVLLTRFNLPSQGVERMVRAQESWLENRAKLFEKYCLSSVKAQTAENIHWIIYFDPESPAWLLERIEEWSADNVFVPIFRATVSNSELCADLHQVVSRPGKWLITTNLDNDDALAVDFAHRLQHSAAQPHRTALYLTEGLIGCDDRLFRRTDRRNAFCSVVESWENPVTCWADWHNLLGKRMPVVEIGGQPAWLQVVHGGNVSNRVHGKLVSPAAYLDLFPGLLAATVSPSKIEFLQDTILNSPIRKGREQVRKAIKGIAMAVLGKDGLDQAKKLLASRVAASRRGV